MPIVLARSGSEYGALAGYLSGESDEEKRKRLAREAADAAAKAIASASGDDSNAPMRGRFVKKAFFRGAAEGAGYMSSPSGGGRGKDTQSP